MQGLTGVVQNKSVQIAVPAILGIAVSLYMVKLVAVGNYFKDASDVIKFKAMALPAMSGIILAAVLALKSE